MGTGVTVKISEGRMILLVDCNEVQELRKEFYQDKQSVKGCDGAFNVLSEC
ncbi:SymE family type I addiction module toxin [Citrobacter sp. Awk 4]|uniref:SymE family type I addiction module toxin n=1 Tax=Citrobacter sp. Awk 4 TaxID=2963955 RepID=UPI003FA40FE5